MNEMELLRRFRDEVPANEPTGPAESALLTAIRSEEARGTRAGRRGRMRRGWQVTAGAAGLGVAGGLFAAVTIGAPDSARTGITVRQLAYRTAAVAAAQPQVRPGQWVYWREKAPGCSPCEPVWTTANAMKAAYVFKGKTHVITTRAPAMKNGRVVLRHGNPVMRPSPFIGQPLVQVLPSGGVSYASGGGRLPVKYRDLGSLPRSPLALDRYLGRLPASGSGPPPFREFTDIQELLTSYVMPPGLTAELFLALGDIPGVTVDAHAVDLAGRAGVAFRIGVPSFAGGGIEETIINPRTFELMGTELIATAPASSRGRVLSGTAILRKVLVSGPGVLP